MDLAFLKALSEIGVAGILAYAVYFLLNYLKGKDQLIETLVKVNQEQNEAIKDTNNLLSVLVDKQRESSEYAKYGYWWVQTHQPTKELCEICNDYLSCNHPRKIIFKK